MSFKDKEEEKAWKKEWYQKNKEKIRLRTEGYKKENLRIIEEGRWDEHIKELYPTELKPCSIENGKERPINHFSRDIRIPCGMQSECRGCIAYRDAERRTHRKRFPDQEMISRGDFLEIYYAEKCYVCGSDNEHNTVDRKESKMGYLKDNVATCCWKCNNMKGAMSLNELVEHCRLIAKNNRG